MGFHKQSILFQLSYSKWNIMQSVNFHDLIFFTKKTILYSNIFTINQPSIVQYSVAYAFIEGPQVQTLPEPNKSIIISSGI